MRLFDAATCETNRRPLDGNAAVFPKHGKHVNTLIPSNDDGVSVWWENVWKYWEIDVSMCR